MCLVYVKHFVVSFSLLACEVSDIIIPILQKRKLKSQCLKKSQRSYVNANVRSLLDLFDSISFYSSHDPLHSTTPSHNGFLPVELIELTTGRLTSGSLNLFFPLLTHSPTPCPTPLYLNAGLTHHLPQICSNVPRESGLH